MSHPGRQILFLAMHTSNYTPHATRHTPQQPKDMLHSVIAIALVAATSVHAHRHASTSAAAAAAGHTGHVQAQRPQLRSTFLKIYSDNGVFSDEEWAAELRAVKAAGITSVVLPYAPFSPMFPVLLRGLTYLPRCIRPHE